MRRGCKRLVLVAASLLVATPATAWAADHDPGGYAVTAVRSDVAASDRQRARAPEQLPDTAPARLVSLPVAPDLNFGLGLFSVVGSTEKEMVRRRTEPLPDVRTRESRVAAVGLSLRF